MGALPIEGIVDNAFQLGVAGFMLLIVLILVIVVVLKLLGVFAKIPDKLDNLTTEMAKSNKELSNQLIKTSVVQENMLGVMKEIIISVNNSTVKMAAIEDKVEEVSDVSTVTLKKLEEMSNKLEKVLSK